MTFTARHPSKALKLLLPGVSAVDVCTYQAVAIEIRDYLALCRIFPDTIKLPRKPVLLMQEAERDGSVTFSVPLLNKDVPFQTVEATLRDPHHIPIPPLDYSSVGL